MSEETPHYGHEKPAGAPPWAEELVREIRDVRARLEHLEGLVSGEAGRPRFERDGKPTAVLDTLEAAAYLGVSEPTLRRLIRDGEVPHIRIGRALRFRVADLDAYLNKQRSRFWDSEEEVMALIQTLKNEDADWSDRFKAGLALARGGVNTDEAFEGFLAIRNSKHQELRVAAVCGLGNMGRRAVPFLLEALKDPSGGVVEDAVRSLGMIGPDAVEALGALREIALRRPGDESFDRASTLAADEAIDRVLGRATE